MEVKRVSTHSFLPLTTTFIILTSMKEKPPSEPSAPSIEEMELEIWAAEMGDPPKIDLHGQIGHLALSELETFVHQEMMNGTRVIKIVHGRGTGKMRTTVHEWLKKQKNAVLYFRDANSTGQIGGATFALLEEIRRASY